MGKKYTAAISDTDILINMAKVGRLDIIEKIFEKIIVPFFILDVELRRNAKYLYGYIEKYIKDSSVFEIIDRREDYVLNGAALPVINEKRCCVGDGESECAGYASALGIPIIISDNSTEFKYLEEYILLTHKNILALCVHFGYMEKIEAEETFVKINDMLTRPTSLDFQTVCDRSIAQFKAMGWDEYLGI